VLGTDLPFHSLLRPYCFFSNVFTSSISTPVVSSHPKKINMKSQSVTALVFALIAAVSAIPAPLPVNSLGQPVERSLFARIPHDDKKKLKARGGGSYCPVQRRVRHIANLPEL
jgi:hypothetical protein